MRTPSVDRLGERIHALLVGAAAGEHEAGAPGGVRRLLDLGEHLALQGGRVEPEALRSAGFGADPAGGRAGLLLGAAVAGLLSPLDRPRLRLGAHRLATVAGTDEGTAMTAVATAVLAADLCRFELDEALVRLRQTLLEEAPTALHVRLRPLGWTDRAGGGGDPGAALQVAITALFRSDDVRGAVAQATGLEDDPATAALAGALAGARHGMEGVDADLLDDLPARERVDEVAAALAAVASADPPTARAVTGTAAAAALARIAGPALLASDAPQVESPPP